MKKETEVAACYPIFLNINNRKCVVVGGGQVALRKVKALLEHSADIEVVSSGLCPELVEIAGSGEIHTITREYRVGDLKNAFVAIAATDNAVINQQVVAEARSRAVLVNVVDDAKNSDFVAPSYMRRGDVAIAISTGGKSPALARKIRSRLEKELGDEYAVLANLIGEVRSEARQRKIKIDSNDWQEALDLDQLLGLLRQGEKERAKATLLSNLKMKQR
jgi:siroheme synthase-like protein